MHWKEWLTGEEFELTKEQITYLIHIIIIIIIIIIITIIIIIIIIIIFTSCLDVENQEPNAVRRVPVEYGHVSKVN
ncbi:hypothetical protein ANN_09895 [Periplaneta americana]|uniref:Uncharacterized protein n=1 Tax=Periplaneta americana TaxID=6978 RepID=A0ABQ8TPM7_PERAM|nr:hypothetical protein ANN_09895 [Periplaneta americana]